MARYLVHVQTGRLREAVFADLSDLRHLEDWDPGTDSARQVEGDGPALGATYDVKAGKAELRYEIERFDPPNVVEAVGRSRFLTSTDTITVAPGAGGKGTDVTYHADLRFNGPLRLLDPLLAVLLQRLGKQAGDGLASYLDGTRLR